MWQSAIADVPLLLLVPFLAAFIAPALVRGLGDRAAWLLAVAPLGLFLQFLGFLPQIGDGARLTAGVSWVPSFAVNFSVAMDGLSLLFALLISGIGTLIVIYAGGYLKGHPDLGRFLSYLLAFLGAMLGVVLADDLITLFVFWELTSITSFLLIGFDHQREAARRAAFQALVITGGGGLALLAGLLLLRLVTGATSVTELLALGDMVRGHAAYLPILLLVLGGAFTKSAQMPFHVWLPNAMEAPTPVSAFLHSATMVKAGVYLLMRLHPVLGDTAAWMTLLPLFGGATLIGGAVLAVRQSDLKLMLAYTTVASLGLLVMLTGGSGEGAILGAAAYLMAHAIFKAGLFMVVGIVDHEAGTRQVEAVGGLGRAMPVTFVAALGGGLAMAGLPPAFGFVAKEVLYEGALGVAGIGALLALVALVGNSLMAAIAGAVALKPFLGAPVKTPKHAHEGPPALWLGPLVLAAAGVAAGLLTGLTGTAIVGPVASAVLGRVVDPHLHLIPGHVSAPLILSLLTYVLGAAVFLALAPIRRGLAAGLSAIGWGPDRGFDQLVSGLVALSRAIIGRIQTGRLEAYVTLSFLVLAAALLVPPLVAGGAPAFQPIVLPSFYILGVMLLAVLGLGAVLVARTRLVAIVALGIQGFAVALFYLLFGAPDLSFTQFMVETLSVIILALVMTRLDLAPADLRRRSDWVMDGAVALAVGGGFALVLAQVAAVPFDSRLSDFYAEFSRQIAHGRNVVNVIIVDFRGLDTLGEISVVLVTGAAILALIRSRTRPKPAGASADTPEARA